MGHMPKFRLKLREYDLGTSHVPNYDNPLFTGQHTPADRYGAMHNP